MRYEGAPYRVSGSPRLFPCPSTTTTRATAGPPPPSICSACLAGGSPTLQASGPSLSSFFALSGRSRNEGGRTTLGTHDRVLSRPLTEIDGMNTSGACRDGQAGPDWPNVNAFG